MNEDVKQRTIEWLEIQRGHGAFEEEIEENMNFYECSDEEIEYYFIEWFFTDSLIDDLTEEELNENYSDELIERNRILNKEGADQMNKRNELLKQYKEMKLTYLSFDGYNEIEFHDNDDIHDLYFDMFDTFIKPIFDKLTSLKFIHEHVIFNHFYTDENNIVWGEFYEPQISLQLTDSNFDDEINQCIELITK